MQNQAKNEEKYSFLRLLLTVALAAAAAYVFRRSAGIWAMIPLVTLICLAASFIRVGTLIRAFAFAACVFVFNTVEQDNLTVTLTFTLLCLFAVLVFGYGVNKLRNNSKKIGIPIIICGLIASVALNIIFVGNPITALRYEKTIDEYLSDGYPESGENIGNISYSRVYYDFPLGVYAKEATSSYFPTTPGTVAVSRSGVISDSFSGILQNQLAEHFRSEIVDALRIAFPNGNFTVTSGDIAGFPSKKLLSGEESAVADCVSYEIRLGGIQTAGEFRKAVKDYTLALDDSGVGYNKILFYSGIGAWYRQSAIVTQSNHPGGELFSVTPRLLKLGTDIEFNEYLKRLFVDWE